MMELPQAIQEFDTLKGRMRAYDYALALASWDMETLAPPKGKPYAARSIGILSGEAYSLKVSPKMRELLEVFGRHQDDLSPVLRREWELLQEDIDKLERIPKEEYQQFNELCSTSQFVWEEAKEKDDFSLFSPYLEKVVGYVRRFAGLTHPGMHPYEACLDDYEKGLTLPELDSFFSAVREKTVPLVARIGREGREIRSDFLSRPFPLDKQREISARLMELLGFDTQAGVIAVSEHPFTTEISPGDVRLTTHYYEDNMISAILSTVHEVGHGLYEQHAKASALLEGSLLNSGVSMGIHESQSRFYENRLCRSQAFWEFFYPALREAFPDQLADVNAPEFYRAVNLASPGLIRIEADELTYNLHIMVRYELERLLLEESVQVPDLPGLWREKYEEYLGIVPATDREGVMQDVHWAAGLIGYFPSYALGNAYSAQVCRSMEADLDVDGLCRRGDFSPIGGWLDTHIHQYGRLKTPGALITDITGEPLNPAYLTAYLEKKFAGIYFG